MLQMCRCAEGRSEVCRRSVGESAAKVKALSIRKVRRRSIGRSSLRIKAPPVRKVRRRSIGGTCESDYWKVSLCKTRTTRRRYAL